MFDYADSTTLSSLCLVRHRCGHGETLPAWLTEADLDFYTEEFKRTGSRRGGCNGRYQGSNASRFSCKRDCVSGDNSVALYVPFWNNPIIRPSASIVAISGRSHAHRSRRPCGRSGRGDSVSLTGRHITDHSEHCVTILI
jgi:hypothetical protein